MPCVSGPGSNSLPFRERFLFGDTRARGGLGVDTADEPGLARFVLDLGLRCWPVVTRPCGPEGEGSLGSGRGGGGGEEGRGHRPGCVRGRGYS